MTNDDTPAERKDQKKPSYNQKQYEMLQRCSEKQDISEWNEWREKNPFEEIQLQRVVLGNFNLKKANFREVHLEGAIIRGTHLDGADLSMAHLEGVRFWNVNLEGVKLSEAHLQGADFQESHLEGAYLGGAHLEGASLMETHLEGASLWGAHLERADFTKAHLEGAVFIKAHLEGTDLSIASLQATNFSYAIVDSQTLIWNPEVNKWQGKPDGPSYTDFEGIGLDSVRISPGLKQLLEYNLRRSNWQSWYQFPVPSQLLQGRLSYILFKIKSFPGWLWRNSLVRPFWWLSDYGFSTMRIIACFFELALAFAVMYWLYPGMIAGLADPQANGFLFWRALYFSIVTMTTLGFGDMHANPDSFWGHTLLMLQVLLGYLMLAALVTRLAILFMADGPAPRFTSMSKEAKQKLKELEESKRKKWKKEIEENKPDNTPPPPE